MKIELQDECIDMIVMATLETELSFKVGSI
jgi:hypothetical protein